MRRAEYGDWDHIVYMDDENARGLYCIFGKDPDSKISRLLDWTDRPGDVADPWYTGNFDATYRDVLAGCTAMLEQLRLAEHTNRTIDMQRARIFSRIQIERGISPTLSAKLRPNGR